MEDWYFINMYTLPNDIHISVFTDKNNIHHTKLEVCHNQDGYNLSLEGNGIFSSISSIIYPDVISTFVLEDTLYHEISQEEINNLFDYTWHKQIVVRKEDK